MPAVLRYSLIRLQAILDFGSAPNHSKYLLSQQLELGKGLGILLRYVYSHGRHGYAYLHEEQVQEVLDHSSPGPAKLIFHGYTMR